MLADRRADVLATRFAAQWLRLQDLDKINPDVRFYPDFDEQLKRVDAARDRALLPATSSARIARCSTSSRPTTRSSTSGWRGTTGFPDVVGSEFRQVTYPDATRRGLLGHGSILTLTSHADRTSPVLRGKWVMEVLLGTPPPPPPPNVPDLDATAEAEDGRLRTVRERMEQHRANPACASCHRMIDPIGLALENFDVTGAWRIRTTACRSTPPARSTTARRSPAPADLRQALLKRSDVAGPHLHREPDDLRARPAARRAPTCRRCARVVRQAAAADYRFSAFVPGIVKAPAFRMKSADVTAATTVAGAQP